MGIWRKNGNRGDNAPPYLDLVITKRGNRLLLLFCPGRHLIDQVGLFVESSEDKCEFLAVNDQIVQNITHSLPKFGHILKFDCTP